MDPDQLKALRAAALAAGRTDDHECIYAELWEAAKDKLAAMPGADQLTCEERETVAADYVRGFWTACPCRVVIEVNGGCVTNVYADDPAAITVLLADRDNFKAGDKELLGQTLVEPLSAAGKDITQALPPPQA